MAILLLFANLSPLFGAIPSAEYLCQLGIAFYKLEQYNDALQEFNNVLSLDPANQTAREYVNRIYTQTCQQQPLPASELEPSPFSGVDQIGLSRHEAMDNAILGLGGGVKETIFGQEDIAKRGHKIGNVYLTGRIQLGLGINSSETIWKRANYDMNERNWRMLSDAALNRRFNTFDSRVYDSLIVNMDTDNKEGFNFHSNITVDPWSFTGKTSKQTYTTDFGDIVEVEQKYWSNTGYTVNQTVRSLRLGNSFNLPETKVKDGIIGPYLVNGAFTPADQLSVSGSKIYRQFQPVRELWFDHNSETANFRIFPIAYQDQALVSDDPLGMTNHHIWWEDSLWLRSYAPGIYNHGVTVPDFTKGYWDNSLQFLSRDPNGAYLTALRGAAMTFQPDERTYFSTTAATPKTLWQDYGNVDNAISASRFKHYLADNFMAGATLTGRVGFNSKESNNIDQKNFVGGMDLGYEPVKGIKGAAEVLASQTHYDLTDQDYRTKSRGNAYYFSVVGRYPFENIMDLAYGYDEIMPQKGESFLMKAKAYFSYIDEGFFSALSSFRNTRIDTFWGRHISFRKPFDYYYAGLEYPTLRWDEINATRIGDGIDIGRQTAGFRWETIFADDFHNLFDLRHVQGTNGNYVETVTRDEMKVKITDKLTGKLLGIYHNLPKTTEGIDPFIYADQTGDFLADWSSNPIDGDKDPSLATGSLGFDYAFTDWLSANTIWEYTNDYTLAYGNFPRGVFNSSQLARIFFENGKKYRDEQVYLYDQQIFPQPPYPYYNIFKFGLNIVPMDKVNIYLDYTRNPFEFAGQNSDLMNHNGLEISYMPTEKFGMLFKYNYSRWKNPVDVLAGNNKLTGHHNFFMEFRYLPSKDDELILQYGEGNVSPIGNITFDPYGGSLLTIDTQHLIRLYYRRKF